MYAKWDAMGVSFHKYNTCCRGRADTGELKTNQVKHGIDEEDRVDPFGILNVNTAYSFMQTSIATKCHNYATLGETVDQETITIN